MLLAKNEVENDELRTVIDHYKLKANKRKHKAWNAKALLEVKQEELNVVFLDALHDACKTGKIAELRKFVEFGCSLSVVGNHGARPVVSLIVKLVLSLKVREVKELIEMLKDDANLIWQKLDIDRMKRKLLPDSLVSVFNSVSEHHEEQIKWLREAQDYPVLIDIYKSFYPNEKAYKKDFLILRSHSDTKIDRELQMDSLFKFELFRPYKQYKPRFEHMKKASSQYQELVEEMISLSETNQANLGNM